MKIAYTEETLAILESMQLQTEHIDGIFHSRSTFDEQKITEELIRNYSKFPLSKNSLDPTIDFFKSFQGKLPTKYEDPIDYPKLVKLLEMVSEAAISLKYELPETISIGTVCSSQMNAHIIQVGKNKTDYLLVFNRQMFLFIDLLSRYIAWLISNEVKNHPENERLVPRKPTELEIQKLDEIIYYIINDQGIFRDNAGYINIFVALDKFGAKLPNIDIDDVGLFLRDEIDIPMVTFVIAHELMHVHLKHTITNSKTVSVSTPFDDEIFCDINGLNIAVQTATNFYKDFHPNGWQSLASVGSVLFLSCLDITQRAAYVLNNGTMPPHVMEEVDIDVPENNKIDSYPTPLFRLMLVYNKLKLDVERAFAPNSSDWVFENCDWIDTFFMHAWKEMKGLYLDRYNERKRMLDVAQKYLSKE